MTKEQVVDCCAAWLQLLAPDQRKQAYDQLRILFELDYEATLSGGTSHVRPMTRREADDQKDYEEFLIEEGRRGL